MALENRQQYKVDALIDHFWRNGYLTLSRKYGKYLPAPQPVGNYEVDAVAKYKQKIALGVTISGEELNDTNIYSKLSFLATRHTKYSNRNVTLFVGVPQNYLIKAKMIVAGLEETARKNIKIVPIPDKEK